MMKWLLDFFYCRSWKEFFVLSVLAAVALIAFWALLVAVFVLFG